MVTWTYKNIRSQGHSLTLVEGHSDSEFSNFFFLETAWLIEAKFYVKPPWDGRMKVGTTGPSHMTKMAVMSINGKNLKKIFSRTKKTITFKLGLQHWVLEYYQIVQMMTLGWPWPILRQGQVWSLMLFYWKKVKQWIFRNYCNLWCQSW